jgi:hypothetical protein
MLRRWMIVGVVLGVGSSAGIVGCGTGLTSGGHEKPAAKGSAVGEVPSGTGTGEGTTSRPVSEEKGVGAGETQQATPPNAPGEWTEITPAKHERSEERAWKSPSGNVTVGAIDVDLPFAVPAVLIIDGYRDDIRKEEGSADIVSKEGNESETRFTVKGKQRTHDVILTKQGKKAHFFYIRTDNGAVPDPSEHEQAKQRREALRGTE